MGLRIFLFWRIKNEMCIIDIQYQTKKNL